MANAKLVNLEWLQQNVPCQQACPVLTNAGGYVSLIAQGRYEEAYQLAEAPNPLASICGHICAAPCEKACRRGGIDEPVAIRALKRFVAERHGVYSKTGRQRIVSRLRNPRKPTGDRVAVVGGGPAGLSAAWDLAALGYRVTIFEAAPVAGGMLALGIPEYRLPRYVVNSQIEAVISRGVELKTGLRLGRDFSVSDLKREGFQAVFVAIGAHKSRELRIDGIHLDGVLNGVDFLLNANLNYRVNLGRKVLVVGGGNVAIDVARSVIRFDGNGADYQSPEKYLTAAVDVARQAVRMGAEVHLVCLEARDEMPAFSSEVEEAEHEGIAIHNRLGPKRILGEGGRVIGLETIRVKSVFDAAGRFNPAFCPNTEAPMFADTVILAIGQSSDLSWIAPEDEIGVTRQGTIQVERGTLQSTAPGVFAGGDVAFGPRNVIEAVADGRRAAMAIDRYIRAEECPKEPNVSIVVFPSKTYRPPEDFDCIPRQSVPVQPLERRIGVAEVEMGYPEEQARLEARRCLQCWVNTIFEGAQAFGSQCILCGGCVDVCPEKCLELTHFDGGSVMIKDETRCLRCALCERRCPVDCITMESFLCEEASYVRQ